MTSINFNVPSKEMPKDSCDCTHDGCMKTGYQYADISLPVELTPKAEIGSIEVECCGEPTVVCENNECSNVSRVVITQRISVSIPIYYKITACASDCQIECDDCK